MVTDGILEAVNQMIAICVSAEQKEAMEMVCEMLGDFDEDQWYGMSEEEKDVWIKGHFNGQERKTHETEGMKEGKISMQKRNFYIFKAKDGTWGCSNEKREGSVLFLKEQEYPVKLYYTRFDLNGSGVVECDVCSNKDELMKALEWHGKCNHVIEQVWDFDLKHCEDEGVYGFFVGVYHNAMDVISKAYSDDVEKMDGNAEAVRDKDGLVVKAINMNKLMKYLEEDMILEFSSDMECMEYFNIYDGQNFQTVDEMKNYQGEYGFGLDGRWYHVAYDEALDVWEELNLKSMEDKPTRLEEVKMGWLGVLEKETIAIENAKAAAIRNGYDQFVVRDVNGNFSFTRSAYDKPATPIFDDEKIIGKVAVSYQNGVRIANYSEIKRASLEEKMKQARVKGKKSNQERSCGDIAEGRKNEQKER